MHFLVRIQPTRNGQLVIHLPLSSAPDDSCLSLTLVLFDVSVELRDFFDNTYPLDIFAEFKVVI